MKEHAVISWPGVIILLHDPEYETDVIHFIGYTMRESAEEAPMYPTGMTE